MQLKKTTLCFKNMTSIEKFLELFEVLLPFHLQQ